MTTARDIMHAGTTCVGKHETLAAVARHMGEHGVGALPLWGEDDRLHGMLTERDIVIKCLAAGHDPDLLTAAELAAHNVYRDDANASVEEMLTVMSQHQVRRLPRHRQRPHGGHRVGSGHRPPPTRTRHRRVRQSNLRTRFDRQRPLTAAPDHMCWRVNEQRGVDTNKDQI